MDELVPHNYRTIICGPIQIQNTNYIVNLLAAVRACDNEQELAHLNTFRPRQNCRDFADDIFKCISLNENV